MSQKHNIIVHKTAAYYSLGNIKTAQTIWIVIHGYGYLAKDFINFFQPILTKKTVIIAPEALSKFYLRGVNGNVGASWMTKENREEEIADYMNYLNQLYDSILKQVTSTNPKINIVGFSQGGATASRWLSNGKIKCTNFILWSSVFPADMDLGIIAKINTFFIYGNQDNYLTEERIKLQKRLLQQSDLKIKTILFNGGHDIPADILEEQTKLNNWN